MKKLILFLLICSLFAQTKNLSAKFSRPLTISTEVSLIAAGIVTSLICKKKIKSYKYRLELFEQLKEFLKFDTIDQINEELLSSEAVLDFFEKNNQSEILQEIIENEESYEKLKKKLLYGKIGFWGGITLSSLMTLAFFVTVIKMIIENKREKERAIIEERKRKAEERRRKEKERAKEKKRKEAEKKKKEIERQKKLDEEKRRDEEIRKKEKEEREKKEQEEKKKREKEKELEEIHVSSESDYSSEESDEEAAFDLSSDEDDKKGWSWVKHVAENLEQKNIKLRLHKKKHVRKPSIQEQFLEDFVSGKDFSNCTPCPKPEKYLKYKQQKKTETKEDEHLAELKKEAETAIKAIDYRKLKDAVKKYCEKKGKNFGDIEKEMDENLIDYLHIQAEEYEKNREFRKFKKRRVLSKNFDEVKIIKWRPSAIHIFEKRIKAIKIEAKTKYQDNSSRKFTKNICLKEATLKNTLPEDFFDLLNERKES